NGKVPKVGAKYPHHQVQNFGIATIIEPHIAKRQLPQSEVSCAQERWILAAILGRVQRHRNPKGRPRPASSCRARRGIKSLVSRHLEDFYQRNVMLGSQGLLGRAHREGTGSWQTGSGLESLAPR